MMGFSVWSPCGMEFNMADHHDRALYDFHLKVCYKCKNKMLRSMQ